MTTSVSIEEPQLENKKHLLPYLIALFFASLWKVTAVWIAVAMLAPHLGITWLMVLVAMWALHHLRPLNYKAAVRALNRMNRDVKPSPGMVRADEELLRKRAAL